MHVALCSGTLPPMTLRLTSLLPVAVLLAVLVAGCGSSPSAEETYAGNLCSDVTQWKDSVTQSVDDIKQQVKSPSSGMVDSITTEAGSAVDATKALSSNLKALGKPKTDNGAQVEQQIDAFRTQVKKTVSQVQQAAAGATKNASVSEIASTVSSLSPTVAALKTSAQSMLSSIEASSQAWKDGFQKAGSCKPYR